MSWELYVSFHDGSVYRGFSWWSSKDISVRKLGVILVHSCFTLMTKFLQKLVVVVLCFPRLWYMVLIFLHAFGYFWSSYILVFFEFPILKYVLYCDLWDLSLACVWSCIYSLHDLQLEVRLISFLIFKTASWLLLWDWFSTLILIFIELSIIKCIWYTRYATWSVFYVYYEVIFYRRILLMRLT